MKHFLITRWSTGYLLRIVIQQCLTGGFASLASVVLCELERLDDGTMQDIHILRLLLPFPPGAGATEAQIATDAIDITVPQ